jgi:hypothetical protein
VIHVLVVDDCLFLKHLLLLTLEHRLVPHEAFIYEICLRLWRYCDMVYSMPNRNCIRRVNGGDTLTND